VDLDDDDEQPEHQAGAENQQGDLGIAHRCGGGCGLLICQAGQNRRRRRCTAHARKAKKMIEVERPADLAQYIGKEIGVSDWFTVDQAIIDKFAEATGDHQWIHVDVERAKREMPGGKTIAHGYLTLSLVPRLAATLYRVKSRSRGLNYGSNRVRFTGQVPAGSRVRLRQTIKSVEPTENGGVRITSESTMEVEGVSRPALVAETISMQFE
ncbi:MAG TPA: MaoC family dehydratase, partial [Stellaceae bacterium]|nr:MaoC family dehydratase [Stellaceae bacterium]